MTTPSREWMRTFADPAVREALRQAAVECMRQICDDDPDDCECVLNMYTPVEFYHWLETEIIQGKQRPVRFEPGHKPHPKRDERPPNLNLAAAS